MSRTYVIAGLGILLLTMTVFQVMLGLQVIRFRGPLHWRIHRFNGISILAIGAVHGTLALGTFVFAWF